MKKIIFLFSILFLTSNVSFAHGPKEMELSYNGLNGMLSIDMAHKSDDQKDHYIQKIVVWVEGREEARKRNRQQVSPTGFQTSIQLDTNDVEEGDTIKVKAYCSEGGTKSKTLDVTKEMFEEEVSEASETSE